MNQFKDHEFCIVCCLFFAQDALCEHLSLGASQSAQTFTCRRIAPNLYEVPLPDCPPYRVISFFVEVGGSDLELKPAESLEIVIKEVQPMPLAGLGISGWPTDKISKEEIKQRYPEAENTCKRS